MWANCREAGAGCLLLARVLETRSLLRHVEAAVPGARITVVRLRASRAVLKARIRHREHGRDPSWYLDTMAYLIEAMERSEVAGYVVPNEQRPPAAVAAEVLRVAGWRW